MTSAQPFEYKPYEQGVLGVLLVTWKMELQTPLIVRATHGAAVMQGIPRKKGRGSNVAIAWEDAEQKRKEKINGQAKYSQLTDFNYHFTVQEGKIEPEYQIPASSVRGTLRNAAIKCLVEKIEDRRAFTVKIKKGQTMEDVEAQINNARKILREQHDGWHDILTLFGCAFDPLPGETPPLTWAGRMRLDTTLDALRSLPSIDCVGTQIKTGPLNIHGHVMVRNPIDRVSMSAKEGGLHFNLEMSPGEVFTVDMRILNPCAEDLRLLNMWHGDINEGYIRFGGLTSQGRGRVEIIQENYELYVSQTSLLYPEIVGLGKPDQASGTMLDNIWRGAEFTNIAELNQLKINQLSQKAGA